MLRPCASRPAPATPRPRAAACPAGPDAAPVGRVEVSGTSYFMRSVGRWPDGALWLLASDADARATQGLLWTWVAGFVLFAASATFAATWILTRRVLQPIEALGEGARRVAGGGFEGGGAGPAGAGGQ